MKAILNAHSHESLNNEVDLTDFPFASGLEPVFRFMYTGKLDVPKRKLHAAWRAALYLEFDKAEQEITQRIISLETSDLNQDQWFDLFLAVGEGHLADRFPELTSHVSKTFWDCHRRDEITQRCASCG
eukprot:GABV01009872.1.p1 GENE.GABV01009872.1~~GABV01009872.1.p1  ORF type:complete len:128 (+),score=41.37 GABV01009872.1:50-433(+)